MKIALTSDYFHPHTGGAERSALELARAVKKKGHDVVVYTRGDGVEEKVKGIPVKRIFSDLKEATKKNDVPFPGKVDKKEGKRLKKRIQGEGFDILHSNNRDTAVFTAQVGQQLNIPTVAHIRDYWPICPKRDLHNSQGVCPGPNGCWRCMADYYGSWLKSPFYMKAQRDTKYRREALEAVDLLIYNSGYVKDRVGLEPGSVIYNPIDLDSIPESERKDGQVFYIGNITERKGVPELVRAMRRTDLTLHLIGDGYLLDSIQGYNIVKHGRVSYDRMKDFLSKAEMLVVPSLWPEPFGRVAVEGMAAGVPVIVSGNGGLPEVVDDAGIVLDSVNENTITEAVLAVYDDKKKADELSSKGKERSREFHPSKIAQQMISTYKELSR